jgi:hypothetical protein
MDNGSELRSRQALGLPMPSPKHSIGDTATALVASHRPGALQKVLDQIIACIREHDISCAKTWEEIGRKVDEALGREGAT